mmetsp:Transcript_2843/g.11166  ORF Transcript_2843/g.11166 Transcript_2843/m.11166 type:complete len:585 (-) Transcript_2843:4-1758(-)
MNLGIVHVVCHCGLGDLLTDSLNTSLEDPAVLCGDDRADLGAEHADAVLREGAVVVQGDGAVQRGLPAEGREEAVGTHFLDDLGDKLRGDGHEVDMVGEALRGLNGGNVRVDEDGLHMLLPQRLDGLGSRVVELAGLADCQATRSEHQHPAELLGVIVGDGAQEVALLALDHVQVVVEQKGGIHGAVAGLRVELHGQPWPGFVRDALVGAVIGVREKRCPAGGQGGFVHREAVVLRRDVAASRSQVDAGLVDATVAELHLVGGRTRSQGQKLVAKADGEDWQVGPLLHDFLEVTDGLLALLRVAGAVADEESIELLLGVVVVPRNDLQIDLQVVEEKTDHVVLHATVHRQNCHGRGLTLLLLRFITLRALDRHLVDQVPEVRIVPSRRGGPLADDDGSQGGAPRSQELRDGARVHAEDAGHIVLLQPLGESPCGGKVRGAEGIFRDDDGNGVDPLALKVLRQPVYIGVVAWHAVVADEREGHDQDLAGEGWVGEGLRVADHARRENDLACRGDFGSKAPSLVDLSGPEPQLGRIARRGLPSRKLVDLCQCGNWFFAGGRGEDERHGVRVVGRRVRGLCEEGRVW